jgi:uncharacterized membrane protein YcjF (UPF0283 family)
VLIGLGAVLIVVGAVWLGQGVGWIGGSFMTGQTAWAVIGVVVLLLGAALVRAGIRMARLAQRDPDA